MPRPKTGDKLGALLRAAAVTIAEEGIGASTAKIAKAASVAEGSLFRLGHRVAGKAQSDGAAQCL